MPSNLEMRDKAKAKHSKRKYGMGKTGGAVEVPLPSGNVCLVNTAGPEELIQAGILDDLDSLTAMVQDLHVERVLKGKPGKAAAEAAGQRAFLEIIKDKPKWQLLTTMLNAVTVYCVVEPTVLPVPAPGEPRDPDALYVDKVNLMDKVAVFQAALGETLDKVRAAEPFHEGSEGPVADVEPGADVSVPAEQSAGTGG